MDSFVPAYPLASTQRVLNTKFGLASALFAAAIIPGVESLDIYIAQHFYNAGTGEWLASSGRTPLWRLLYQTPRLLIAATGICLILIFVISYFYQNYEITGQPRSFPC